MPIKQKHFYMIRHGQTEANLAHVMAGSNDSPLTEKGREQAYIAQTAVKALEIKPKAIIHSHLSRARDTALILNEVLNIDMHEDPDLAEIHAGDWEGKDYADCPELLTGWCDPPNGETYEEFMTRIKRGKNKHLDHFDGPVLIVCHGGVMRAFGRIYGLDIPAAFKNCHLHEFHPHINQPSFPWKSWQYDVENETAIRRPSENYPNLTESEKTAS